MCSVRAVLAELLAAIDERDAAKARDEDKIKRTLLEEYPPGTHPVLPEHRPYGPMAEVGS